MARGILNCNTKKEKKKHDNIVACRNQRNKYLINLTEGLIISTDPMPGFVPEKST